MVEEKRIRRYEPGVRALESRPPTLLDPFATVEMTDAPDPLAIWRVFLKRRWTIATIFTALFTVVLIATLMQTPIYQAKTLLEFEKENPSIPTLQELFQLETISSTYLETQYQVLQSESLAERVINELQLEQYKEFRGTKSPQPSGEKAETSSTRIPANQIPLSKRDPKLYEKVLKNFQSRLYLEPIKNSRLVEVSFESQNPELAAQALNTLASKYVEQSVEGSQKATEWLSKQLEEVKGKLEKSEATLQGYAQEQKLLYLETLEGDPENIVNERLRQLQGELTKAQALRIEKEALYRLVEAGDYGSLPGVFENKLLQDLTIRLADLKRDQAQLAATFSFEYPKVKQIQNQIDELDKVLNRERERAVKRITNDYLAAKRQENLLRQAFESQRGQANDIAERSVKYKMLRREVDTNRQLYQDLLNRLSQAGVSAGLKAGNIRIVDSARPPVRPAKPSLLLNLSLAVVLGLGLGVGAAWLQEYLDSSLKSPADVERFLHVPALGQIPVVESLAAPWRGNESLVGRARFLASRARVIAERARMLASGEMKRVASAPTQWFRIDEDGHRHSLLSEAFRSLRTSVLLPTTDSPLRSLLITSSGPGEGKTTVAANLAIALAQLGRRVLLIDADLRRPAIHKAFDLENSLGLGGYLSDHQNWQAAVQPTGVPGLDALVSGPVPTNPAELLSTERMRNLLNEAVTNYSFVVLDSPPLLDVADARILATLVEGVMLVVEGGTTPRELVYRAGMATRDVGGKVIGIVLNKLDPLSSDYYYYRYHRGDFYVTHAGISDKSEGDSHLGGV